MDEFSQSQLDLMGDPGGVSVRPLKPNAPLQGKSLSPSVDELRAYAAKTAKEKGLDPAVFLGLIDQESGWNVRARSKKGARGLTQMLPDTAAEVGVKNLDDPLEQIAGGAEYLARQLKRYGGDYEKALAAYNAGPGAVDKHGGIPPFSETQQYVPSVLAHAKRNRGDMPADSRPALWQDVAADPDVKAMSDDDYNALRQRYFENVIAPELDTGDVKEVHEAFMDRTKRPGAVEKMLQGARDLLSRAAEPGQSGDVLRGTPAQPAGAQDALSIDQGFGNMPDLATPSATAPEAVAPEAPAPGLNADQVDVIMQGLNKRATEAAQKGDATFWVEPGERKALREYLAQLPPNELAKLAQRQDAAGATVRGIVQGGGDWGEGIKGAQTTLTDGPMVDDYGNTLSADEGGGEPSQMSKGLVSGVIGMKQMGAAAAQVPAYGAILSQMQMLTGFDEIDAGKSPKGESDFVDQRLKMYREASPAAREQMRQTYLKHLSESTQFMGVLNSSWAQYEQELKQTAGRVPNATDIRDVQGFADWFAFNAGQAIPYMGAAVLSGLLAGPTGLAAFGYGTGVGDIHSGNLEKGVGVEGVGAALIGGVPYAALEFLGPGGRMVRNAVSQKVMEKVAEGYFKRLGKEIPANMLEEFINEAGQEFVKDASVASSTGDLVLTEENLVKWFNAGMAGVAGAPMATTAINTAEHVAAKAKGDLEQRKREITQPEQAEPSTKKPEAKKPEQRAEPDGRVEPSLKSEPGDVGGPTEPTMKGEAPADLGGRPDPKNKPVPVQARGIADAESHTATDEPSIADDGPTIGEAIDESAPDTAEPKLRAGENVEGVTVESKREAPIVAFRKEAAKIEAALPPVEDGYVRLWRGNRPGEEGSNPSFTTSLSGIALPFQKAYGGKLTYVDVPKEKLEEYAQGRAAATDEEFTVPADIAKQARLAEPRAQDAPKTAEPAQTAEPEGEKTGLTETPEPAKAKRSRLLKDPVAQQEPKAEEAPKTAEPAAQQTAEPEKAERQDEAPKPKRSRMLKEERAEPTLKEAPQTAEPARTKTEQATAQAAAEESTAQQTEQETKAAPADRFDGQYGKGMTTFNARQQQKRLQSEKPELDWKIEPLEEHGPDRFSVVGYPRQADKPNLASAESQAERQEKDDKQRDRELSNAISETLTTANAQQQAAAKRVLKHAGPLGISNPKVVLEQVQAAGYESGPDFGDGPEMSSPLEMDDLIPERAQLVEDIAKAVAADPTVLPMPESVIPVQPAKVGKEKLTAAKPKPIDQAAVRQEILRQAFGAPHIRAALDQGARDHKTGSRRLEAIISEMRDLMGGPKTYGSRLPAMGEAARRTRAGSPHEAVAHPTRAGHWVVQPIVNRPVILNPEVRAELERMAKNAGWAEKGGRLLRDESDNEVETGRVIGRTTWVPKEDWWAQRGVNLNEEQTRKAVQKALAGEPLGSREQKLIDYMTRVAKDTVEQVEAAVARLDAQGLGAQDLSADDPFAVAADLESAGLSSTAQDIVDHDLVAKAMQINPDAVEAIPDSLEPNAFMDRIREIIDEPQSEAQGGREDNAGAPSEEPQGGPAADTGVLAEVAQTKKRKLRQPKSLDRINVLVPARTADGEESVVEMPADEALSRLEATRQKLKELLDCLLS